MARPTQETWDRLTEYITACAAYMDLEPQWDIILVTDEQADEGMYCESEITRDQDKVEIRVGSGFFDDEPERQRLNIVHELCHLRTERLYAALFRTIEDTAGSIAVAAARAALLPMYEQMTEHLALTIAKALPVPDLGVVS